MTVPLVSRICGPERLIMPAVSQRICATEIAAMNDWCHQTEIAFTPTFFINGYQLPPIYKIKDLDYLLTSG